jgi:hypothetical protein
MPLPGTRIFPPGWAEHHRPAAESAMTDTAELRRPAPPTGFDELAGESDYPTPALLATVPVRVQREPRRAGGEEVGDRPVELQLYQVSIPASAPELRANDQVVITVANSDASLAGVILRIREVRLASQLWERDLLCEEATPMTR